MILPSVEAMVAVANGGNERAPAEVRLSNLDRWWEDHNIPDLPITGGPLPGCVLYGNFNGARVTMRTIHLVASIAQLRETFKGWSPRTPWALFMRYQDYDRLILEINLMHKKERELQL